MYMSYQMHNYLLSNSLYIPSLSCNVLCKRASEVCLNTNLAEDASTDIHYGSKNGSERNSNEWRKCIHPKEGDLESWSIDPDVNERDQTVDEGKQDGKHHPKKNHKYVIGDELCVFVDEAHGIVQCWEGLCTLVLVEALLEIKLKKREGKVWIPVFCNSYTILWSTIAISMYNTPDEQCNSIKMYNTVATCSLVDLDANYSRSSEPLGYSPVHSLRPRRTFVLSPPALAFQLLGRVHSPAECELWRFPASECIRSFGSRSDTGRCR